MQLTLSPKTEQLILERMKSGRYASAEEVLVAGLEALDRQQDLGDFRPGEWDTLLAEGEKGGESLEWDDVVTELRQLGAKKPEAAE
jgi:Arc/MetJ-type ribon-helix-helix transcriptional regulator